MSQIQAPRCQVTSHGHGCLCIANVGHLRENVSRAGGYGRARARAGRNAPLRKLAEERFLAWPAAQDNAPLRLARRRMLGRGDSGGISFRSAASQQGLLQILHDFCDRSNALCADCQFPALAREFAEV